MASNDVLCRYLLFNVTAATENSVKPGKLLAGGTCHTCISREASSYGSGRSKAAFTIEKIAVFAPIPSASTRMVPSANPGLRRTARNPYRRSAIQLRMEEPPGPGDYAMGARPQGGIT